MLKRCGSSAALVTLCVVALLMGNRTALAADVHLTAADTGTTTSFNAAGHWDSGQAPSAGNNYFIGFDFRTPAQDASFTFAGDSLSIDPGSRFLWKSGAANGSTGMSITFPALIFNGGIVFCANPTGSFTLQGSTGSISVHAATTVHTDEAPGIRPTIIPSD